MAVSAFLKIDTVTGESINDKHKDQIDVLSWSWGLSNAGTGQLGQGSGGGKVNVQDMSFSKYTDKATPRLVSCCCTGTHLDKATLFLEKSGEANNFLQYLQIDFEQVVISSYQTGGAADGSDRVIESISFNFKKFTMTYTPQDAKGKEGTKIPVSYDIGTNKSA
ncbi:Hcp family type VI secretion system effector [Acidimangrovimonas sediminis]|uniref:Hcp family type VI secretion system effector n=1 Tax=Acidimangrovimonas sediminis TaxID=2056283 RepID=UPI000C80D32A|nr:type VI secretion system tube protein Hcp [Acidimangrovimonas sediminis]